LLQPTAVILEPKQTFRAKPASVLHREPFIPHKAAQRTTGEWWLGFLFKWRFQLFKHYFTPVSYRSAVLNLRSTTIWLVVHKKGLTLIWF